MNELNFWFQSDLGLSVLGQAIRVSLGTGPFEQDHENVWEWLEAESRDGLLHINVSRKHRAGPYGPGHRVRVLVRYFGQQPPQEVCESIGRRLARELKTRISFGSVKRSPGEELTYSEERTFDGEA